MAISSHNLLQLEYLIPLDLENNELTCSIFHRIPIYAINKTAILDKIKSLPKTFLEAYSSNFDEVSKFRSLVSNEFPKYNICIIHELSEIIDSPHIIQIVFQDNYLPQRNNKKLQITISTTAATDFELCIINMKDLSWRTLSKSIRDNLHKFDTNILKEYKKALELFSINHENFPNELYFELSDDQRDHIFDEETIKTGMAHIVLDKSIDPYFFSKPDEIINDLGLTNDNKQDFFTCIKLINSNDEYTSNNLFFNNYLLERFHLETLISLQAAAYPQRKTIISSTNKKLIPLAREIGASARTSTAKKINRQFSKLAVELNSTLSEFLNQITTSQTLDIKFISNSPLEWATDPTSNLPLMIKHNVSRIPSSPGYITNNLLLDSKPTLLRLSAFSEILVISSFADNDPIKNDLRDSITNTLKSKREKLKDNVNAISINIKFIEISTAQELIDTLNNNHHPIVVFDLHGGHQKTQPGLLVLKNESVLIFDIIKKTRIPPVVILSACDTNPIDRNHYSTAAGFIMGGAKTVVASALPISSRLAAIFISRLILRMEHILPIEVRSKHGEVSWGKLILGMLRRTYYFELLNALQKEKKFTLNKKTDLLFKIGMHLDPLHANWHTEIQRILLHQLSMTAYDLKKFITDHFQFPECLRYIQIGNPELIRIVHDENLV